MSMSFLISTVEAELPPGFRFHPRDDELICDYLVPKVSGKVGLSDRCPPMIDVDLNKVEPWDLPAVASVGGKQEWYFFSLRDRKYATGQRTNRATVSGYWKATGKDRAVARRGAPVGGMRKTLVFYQGRAPKGRKTEWVMHEYRLLAHERASNLTSKEDWVLCRVICKKKSGGGGATSKPRNFTTIAQDTSTATSSPPLPPLMDTTLAQLQATMNATTTAAAATTAFEQVPCFSSFSNNIASNNNSATVVQPCYLPMVTGSNGSNYMDHGLPDFGSYLDPTLNWDKKLLKAVLSQLSSMGGEVVPSLPPEMAAAVSSTWMNHF